MSSSSSSSSSSARGSESGGRGGLPWALLDRAPRLADLGAMASEADVLVHLVPPPGVSTVFLHRALFPDDGAWDTPQCRVEGADASGRFLVAMPSPRAPGESGLLVCRPVPVPTSSGSGGAAKAKGKARFLPAVPEDTIGYDISTALPIGIISDRGARSSSDSYVVAQLQMPREASTPIVAVALCYSSDENAWTVKQVAAESRWTEFRAKAVVSHDRGDGSDGHLVFVDLRRGILLFNPRLNDSRFVQFPDGCGGTAEVDAMVDSSEGNIVYLMFEDVEEGTIVALWCLSEQELRWNVPFDLRPPLRSDEVFACDHRLLPLRGVPSIGALDPNKMTRIVFNVRSPVDGTLSSFLVEVMPAAMVLRRVEMLGDVQSCGCVDYVVCRLPGGPPKTRWMDTVNSALYDAKQIGLIALSAAQKGRNYADELPGAVQLVGGALGLPYTANMVTAAKAIKTVNTCFGIAETATSWAYELRPDAPPQWEQYATVGTTEEALRAMEVWKELGEPAEMEVRAAPGTTLEQVEDLRKLFVEVGAESLINSFDYVFVEQAPHF